MKAKIPLIEKITMVFYKFRFTKLSAIDIAREIENIPNWRKK